MYTVVVRPGAFTRDPHWPLLSNGAILIPVDFLTRHCLASATSPPAYSSRPTTHRGVELIIIANAGVTSTSIVEARNATIPAEK